MLAKPFRYSFFLFLSFSPLGTLGKLNYLLEMPVSQNPQPEDLRQRTKTFALRIIKLYGSLPKSTEAQILGKQLLRSGTSVGAHYREAVRSRSKAEYISKVGGGLQELEESVYWLELLADANLVAPQKLTSLTDEANELIAIFVTLSNRAKA
ncbi:four helix bundle protein [Leptolyngbya sp. KIOST-1]|uniref:four helix bundle protein n=1 Tax=Leptolyngbya sp. KIOST-1 TaxID=1229172 RepID=UPI0021F1C75F|nr:four helix bundle protein [Leptolyngbya sp. KIOST-1]